jgi:GNAT superfamily N-acetyltransferase
MSFQPVNTVREILTQGFASGTRRGWQKAPILFHTHSNSPTSHLIPSHQKDPSLSPRPSRSSRATRAATRVVVERSDSAAVSRELWKGLVSFNREQAGPLDYARTVISVRDGKGRLLGGLILQSYWQESYIELLWLSARARGAGFGSRLIQEAERRARRRGSRLIHVNTYSFQAPGFYEKQGYRRFGGISGSPRGESRHFYVKRLRAI